MHDESIDKDNYQNYFNDCKKATRRQAEKAGVLQWLWGTTEGFVYRGHFVEASDDASLLQRVWSVSLDGQKRLHFCTLRFERVSGDLEMCTFDIEASWDRHFEVSRDKFGQLLSALGAGPQERVLDAVIGRLEKNGLDEVQRAFKAVGKCIGFWGGPDW